MLDLNALDFEKGNGLVTVVAQHALTGQVLMVAFGSRESLERTIAAARCTITRDRAACGTRARRAATRSAWKV